MSSAAYTTGGKIILATASDGQVAGCDNSHHSDNPIPLTNNNSVTSGDVQLEVVHYTPKYTQYISGVKLYLKTPGDASSNSLPGTAWVTLALSSGTTLGTGSILAEGQITTSSLGHANSNTQYTITFTSPYHVTAGTVYVIGFEGMSGYTIASGYGIYWGLNSSCSDSTLGNMYYDKVTTGAVASSYKPEISVIGTNYNTSAPTAAYVGDSGASGSTWYPSTFTASENGDGGVEAGTITYDVGSSDTATPTYTQTGLTKAQVVALSNMTGEYFFLRAKLTSSGPENAALGDVTIQYK